MLSKHFVGGRDHQHVCDMCEQDDGRPVLFWQDSDFALCRECISNLYFAHLVHGDLKAEKIIVRRMAVPETTRNAIFERDGWQCLHCGSQESLTLDHIIPFSRGGTTSDDNLQTLCRSCNSKKGDA